MQLVLLLLNETHRLADLGYVVREYRSFAVQPQYTGLDAVILGEKRHAVLGGKRQPPVP